VGSFEFGGFHQGILLGAQISIGKRGYLALLRYNLGIYWMLQILIVHLILFVLLIGNIHWLKSGNTLLLVSILYGIFLCSRTIDFCYSWALDGFKHLIGIFLNSIHLHWAFIRNIIVIVTWSTFWSSPSVITFSISSRIVHLLESAKLNCVDHNFDKTHYPVKELPASYFSYFEVSIDL
jgi:hypothetical protein